MSENTGSKSQTFHIFTDDSAIRHQARVRELSQQVRWQKGTAEGWSSVQGQWVTLKAELIVMGGNLMVQNAKSCPGVTEQTFMP